MFESLKDAIQDLLHGRVAAGDRRAVINEMKRALARARLGVEDLRAGVEQTRQRLGVEQEQLTTVLRRKALAERINDVETVTLATKYEQQHGERVTVLARKLEVQEAEAMLAEKELNDMISQLKSASAGVGSVPDSSPGPGARRAGATDEDLGLPDDAKLQADLDGLARQRARGDADAAAEEKLAELKRRMGRQ
jgi:hypothetical protein